MEIRTSSEIYEEYQKARELEDKLRRANRGMNLLNSGSFGKPEMFYIKVAKAATQNLIGKEEKVYVMSNLPFISWEYSRKDKGVNDFFKDLNRWVSIPLFIASATFNRRRENLYDRWNGPRFREIDIMPSQLTISIEEAALEELREHKIDFRSLVGGLLAKQKDATPEEAAYFRRFTMFLETLNDLKRQVKQKRSEYSYGPPQDETIRISIGPDGYNEQMSALAHEMKIICKKYPFLSMPRIEFLQKKKAPSMGSFLKSNKDELQGAWDELDAGGKDGFDGDFREFCKFQFNEWKEENDMDGYETVIGKDDDEDYEEDE